MAVKTLPAELDGHTCGNCGGTLRTGDAVTGRGRTFVGARHACCWEGQPLDTAASTAAVPATPAPVVRASFVRLDSGEWGVRVQGASVRPNEAVTVSRRDGSTSTVVVGRIVSSVGDVSICEVEKRPRFSYGEAQAETEY